MLLSTYETSYDRLQIIHQLIDQGYAVIDDLLSNPEDVTQLCTEAQATTATVTTTATATTTATSGGLSGAQHNHKNTIKETDHSPSPPNSTSGSSQSDDESGFYIEWLTSKQKSHM